MSDVSHRAPAAFTIPEMLAVVAITIIVLAMLLPSYQNARESAREAICNSNLHEIGLGVKHYALEFKYLPPSYASNYCTWAPLIRLYTNGDEEVFYCPTAPPEAKWVVTFGSGLPAEWGYEADEVRRRVGGAASWPFSYGHNNGGTADSSVPPLGVGDTWNPVRANKVVAASNFMIIADSLIDGIWDHFIDEDVPGEEPAVRHHGGAFVVFGDAHTEFIIPGPYLDPANTGANDPDLRRRWNNDNQPH